VRPLFSNEDKKQPPTSSTKGGVFFFYNPKQLLKARPADFFLGWRAINQKTEKRESSCT